MARKKKKDGLYDRRKARVDKFLSDFERESEDVREELASSIPAYHTLLSLHARTFEEFALLPLAREQGLPYQDPLFDWSVVKPVCPGCGETKRIGMVYNTIYRCNACQKRYMASHDSIISGTKLDTITWMKILNCILEFYPMSKTCSYCKITPETYYNVRTRIFYAMSLLLSGLRLYGHIQTDNTFVRVSYKGVDLQEKDFPEDSIFDDDDFVPRSARKRGGAYSNSEKNQNYICVFCAIDDRGHSVTRYAGIGVPKLSYLNRYVERELFLLGVPKEEPFGLFRVRARAPETKPGDESLFISDGESALIKYGNNIGMKTESHVYRRGNVQVRQSADSHNIQRINNLHKKLKDFLRKTNFVSSAYLPSHLILFDFIQNTGATNEAIGQLFEILTRPGLGKPPIFYKELFMVPNYLTEWNTEGGPFKGLSYDRVYAAYLYGKKKREEKHGKKTEITMDFIKSETGLSSAAVRRNYKNIKTAGLLGKVDAYFDKGKGERKKEKGKKEKKTPVVRQIPREIYIFYDELSKFRQKAPEERNMTQEVFIQELNQKLGTDYHRNDLHFWFKKLEKLGERESLPPLKKDPYRQLGCLKTKNALYYAELYDELVKSYREKNKEIPPRDELFQTIADREGITARTLDGYISQGRRIQKAMREKK